jgi:hypothetical protein
VYPSRAGECPLGLAKQLVGAWRLVEWSEVEPDGTATYPLGRQASGQIVYTIDGHVAAQLVAVGRERFRSDDWSKAATDEGARAFKEYFGYLGRYTIDASRKAVVHHVEGAWFPNVEGIDQVRFFRFEHNRLVLIASLCDGPTWRRSSDCARGQSITPRRDFCCRSMHRSTGRLRGQIAGRTDCCRGRASHTHAAAKINGRFPRARATVIAQEPV